MISPKDFDQRVAKLWDSQKKMAAAKYWKSGKRAGTLRRPAIPIEFDRHQLYEWLWTKVGLGIAQCHYCKAPVDILDLTLDHAIPRDAGGRFAISNMRVACTDCNERKGPLTEVAFIAVLSFSRQLSPYDGAVLLKRLAAAHHGSPSRFFRKPADKGPKPAPPPKQDAMNFELGAF